MKKPILKLVRCHRGPDAGAIRTAMKAYPTHFALIPKGPLKGCVRRDAGSKQLNVFKLGRGFVLEFRPVIRVSAA